MCLKNYDFFNFEAFGQARDERTSKTFKLFLFFKTNPLHLFHTKIQYFNKKKKQFFPEKGTDYCHAWENSTRLSDFAVL